MGRWLIYLKERFPIVTYLILAGGMVVSGSLLAGTQSNHTASVIALIGLLLIESWVLDGGPLALVRRFRLIAVSALS